MLSYEDKINLSKSRLSHAIDDLDAAEQLFSIGKLKATANRAYYSAFHAMRAVLAFDGVDYKKHSNVISDFRKLYIKTGIFEIVLSDYIGDLFDIRSDSDYDDFFVVSREKIQSQLVNAKYIVETIKSYLESKYVNNSEN